MEKYLNLKKCIKMLMIAFRVEAESLFAAVEQLEDYLWSLRLYGDSKLLNYIKIGLRELSHLWQVEMLP